MKAEELRIRNWVKHPDYQHPIQVNAYWILVCSEKEHFEPLPLTEEWLLRAGFVQEKNTFYSDHFDYQLQSNKDGFVFYHEQLSAFYGTEIKFVHQVQNLFFALTGTELAFKTEETK